jgi:hypothetical protein
MNIIEPIIRLIATGMTLPPAPPPPPLPLRSGTTIISSIAPAITAIGTTRKTIDTAPPPSVSDSTGGSCKDSSPGISGARRRGGRRNGHARTTPPAGPDPVASM